MTMNESRYPHVSYHYTDRRGYTLEDYMRDVARVVRLADERTASEQYRNIPDTVGLCVFCDAEDPCCENCGGYGYA